MDSKGIRDQKSISLQREITVLANRKAEEYYADAQWIASRAIEVGLSKTQVAGMLSTINTTSSSAEFLNYLKRQVGKATGKGQRSSTRITELLELLEDTAPGQRGQKQAYSPWLKQIKPHPDSEKMKAFGEVLIEKLESVRKQAIADAQGNAERGEMGADDKAKLCVLYLRQFLKAFEAHYLYQSVTGEGGFEETSAWAEQ